MKDLAIQAALEAGQLMLDWRAKFPPGPAAMTYKAVKDVVTEVDLAAEKLIKEHIRSRYPQHNILAEEGGADPGDSPYTWVIDPLDGTANYAADLATSCVSIALIENERPVLGVVYNPFRDELYLAEEGQGATINDQPIRVGRQEALSTCICCFDLGYNENIAVEVLQSAVFFRPRIRSMRMLGSAVLGLCHVAVGRYDLFLHRSLNPWDMAAGLLIVQEAGGRASTYDNQPATYKSASVVAASPRIHALYFEAWEEYLNSSNKLRPL